LYDNGSSLCCYIDELDLDSFLGNDKLKFNSLVISKSKSRIKLYKKIKKEPTHLEVLKYLKNNYYKDIEDTINKINHNINEDSIDSIFGKYDSSVMGEKRKRLIKKFLLKKVELLNEE
jgi:hypothetical protein